MAGDGLKNSKQFVDSLKRVEGWILGLQSLEKFINVNVSTKDGGIRISCFGSNDKHPKSRGGAVFDMTVNEKGDFVVDEKDFTFVEDPNNKENKKESCIFKREIFKGNTKEVVSRTIIDGDGKPKRAISSIPEVNHNSSSLDYDVADRDLEHYIDELFSFSPNAYRPEMAVVHAMGHRWKNWTAERDPNNSKKANVFESLTLNNTKITTINNVSCDINDGLDHKFGDSMRIDPPYFGHEPYSDEIVYKIESGQYASGGLTEAVLSGDLFREENHRSR